MQTFRYWVLETRPKYPTKELLKEAYSNGVQQAFCYYYKGVFTMASTPEATAANDKELSKLTKVLSRIGKDTTIKAMGDPRSIFTRHIGVLVCQNCGYLNPTAVEDLPIPACIECGLTQAITIFVGPFEKPVTEVTDTNDPTVDLSEDGTVLTDQPATSDNGQ